MKALYLNCSLKSGETESNTAGLMATSAAILEAEGVCTETVRVADLDFAATVDDRADDDWGPVHDKILDSAILVLGSPIWLGEASSLAVKAVERLYGFSGHTNDKGQSIFAGRVGGAVVTGNEDGGKNVGRQLVYSLQRVGFAIPPHADAYWVGEAGPGPSYLEAGRDNDFTQSSIRTMSWNLLHMARSLEARPIPAEPDWNG